MPSRTCVFTYSLFILLSATTLLEPCVLAGVEDVLGQAAAKTDQHPEAQEALRRGIVDFKNGQTKQAEQDFLRAKQLAPELLDARLYLATAYASGYIPGAPGEANVSNAKAAAAEFRGVLVLDPQNLRAMDALGSLLFQMAGQPFNRDLFFEAKSCFTRHTESKADDAQPYYWIGVIDWTLAFRANGELRAQVNHRAGAQRVSDSDPLPRDLREQYSREYGQIIEEGIESLKHAISIKPDYTDAMAYLNLLLRRKADVVTREDEREELLQMADDLVDKIKEIYDERAQKQP
jgi:tetratricopeptide (TPR) repeat protein